MHLLRRTPRRFFDGCSHVRVRHIVNRNGSLSVFVQAVGQMCAYCNDTPFGGGGNNDEVWLGSPMPSPRRSPRVQFVSLQLEFFDGDVLYLCPPRVGLGYLLRIEARPTPLRSCVLPPLRPRAPSQPSLFCAAARHFRSRSPRVRAVVDAGCIELGRCQAARVVQSNLRLAGIQSTSS